MRKLSCTEIIIAAGSEEVVYKIKQLFTDNGFTVTGICSSGNEAIRKVRTLKPALLIANYELPDTNGFEVAKIVTMNNICSVILLADDTQKSYVDRRAGDLDIVCLKRPVSRAVLLNSAELVIKSRQRLQKLEAELNEIKTDLETRKLVDKAKGFLMQKSGLSEQDAYRRIQKQSMDTGMTMKEVSKIIISMLE